MTGLLCAVTANFSFRGPGENQDAYCAADFVPGRGKKQRGLIEPENDEELATAFAAALAPFVVAH